MTSLVLPLDMDVIGVSKARIRARLDSDLGSMRLIT
jgi:hypothetical protein